MTGTGAVILAATEELLARREAAGGEKPESLVDVGRYIFSGQLELPEARTSA